jgi:transposase
MSETRKQYSAEFKAAVAIDAVRGERSVTQIAGDHGIRSHQVIMWRKKLTDEAASLFKDKRIGPCNHKATKEAMWEQVYKEVGKLAVDLGRQQTRSRPHNALRTVRQMRRTIHPLNIDPVSSSS